MRTDISNRDDIIDSRQVIERIEALTDELTAVYEAETQPDDDEPVTAPTLDEWIATIAGDANHANQDEATEYRALIALQEDAEGYAADWRHGETLIRDTYFETYARELADDIGAIDRNASWPQTCIDWEQAAQELQQDYTSVEFAGVTYWIR